MTRRGLRARRPTRPAGPVLRLAGTAIGLTDTGRRPGLGTGSLRGWRTDPGFGQAGRTPCRQVLEGRNPLLVLRFDGAFLLRFAERTFDGWLLNVPPRIRRGFG